MNSRSQSVPTPWFVWAIAGGALLLSLVALIVVVEDMQAVTRLTSPWVMGLNLLTGLSGLAGAIGYGLRARWGAYAFGVSVVGHFIAHMLLIVSAFTLSRATFFTFVGPLVIPIIALAILVAMIRTNAVRRES